MTQHTITDERIIELARKYCRDVPDITLAQAVREWASRQAEWADIYGRGGHSHPQPEQAARCAHYAVQGYALAWRLEAQEAGT